MRGGVCWVMSSTCVEGGLPRPLGGFQPNLIMEPHSPAPAWQLHHPILPKQEPVEEERNDSGINSGSDFHSSSPGSENSQDFNHQAPYTSTQTVPCPSSQASGYYSTPLIPRVAASSSMAYHPSIPLHLGINPLTPPNSEPTVSPNNSHNYLQDSTPKISIKAENTLGAYSPPPNREICTPVSDSNNTITEKTEQEDHLRRLQMTLEKNGLIPPAPSPKNSENSVDDDNKSDLDPDEYDEQGIRIPKMNSHGKVKTFRCKQCDFVAITKLDFWEHSKGHIKADKLLTCPKCPFVTEYKHHLEYHLRNHFGSKPFRCDKCSYSCVNKSMLNSHMKSHSNVYQYRCADCSYATKYCHSLKLHLRKYTHKPAMVLNSDGTPNPLPIIDVYGTRRGPKQKNGGKFEDSPETATPTKVLQNQLAQFMLNTPPQMQLPFPYSFLGGFPGHLSNHLLFPSSLEQFAKRDAPAEESMEQEDREDESDDDHSAPRSPQEPSVLDLSKPDSNSAGDNLPKNRRKGRAFKLERLQRDESFSEEDDDPTTTMFNNVEVVSTEKDEKESTTDEKPEEVTNNNKAGNFNCQYCNIAFGDIILYTMHMGYHGFKDPFTCNMCGEQCNDKVSFFLHIARNPHS